MMWSFFQTREWKRRERFDKVTLHQSAIEFRGSTVDRGLSVDVCSIPYARKRWLLFCFFSCDILPLLVCLYSDATFLSLSLPPLSLCLSCTACFRDVCPQTGSLSSALFFLYADAMILKDNKRRQMEGVLVSLLHYEFIITLSHFLRSSCPRYTVALIGQSHCDHRQKNRFFHIEQLKCNLMPVRSNLFPFWFTCAHMIIVHTYVYKCNTILFNP